MIRKPPAEFHRESAAHGRLRTLHAVADGGVAMVRAGSYVLRGLICWFFAALWGFAALGAAVSLGGLPTVIGVGTMAAVAAWMGRRMFARARDCRRSVSALPG